MCTNFSVSLYCQFPVDATLATTVEMAEFCFVFCRYLEIENALIGLMIGLGMMLLLLQQSQPQV